MPCGVVWLGAHAINRSIIALARLNYAMPATAAAGAAAEGAATVAVAATAQRGMQILLLRKQFPFSMALIT